MPKMKIKLRATYTLFACLLVLFSSTAIAQTKVSGTVTDADSKPLKGATVSEKGTTRGTVTGDNGEFSISANPGASLVISMIGFEALTVKVGTQTSLSIRLKPDVSHL